MRGRRISRTARSARSNSPSRSPCSRKLLLLDEPMAGTGREETERLVALLRRLKGRFPMLLVEHDMTAVFALADRISVLIYGRILASGSPDAGSRRSGGRRRLSRRRDGVRRCCRCTASPAVTARPRCCSTSRCTVKAGEVVTLLGRNGMGKTTTIRTIMGLVRARSGRLIFDGQRLDNRAALPHRPGRHRPGSRRSPDLSDPDASRKISSPPPRRASGRRNGRSNASTSFFPSSPSAAATWATNCPAASSRCWRSAAR